MFYQFVVGSTFEFDFEMNYNEYVKNNRCIPNKMVLDMHEI